MAKQLPSHERNRNGIIHGFTIGAGIQITEGKHISSPGKKKIYKTEHAAQSRIKVYGTFRSQSLTFRLYINEMLQLQTRYMKGSIDKQHVGEGNLPICILFETVD